MQSNAQNMTTNRKRLHTEVVDANGDSPAEKKKFPSVQGVGSGTWQHFTNWIALDLVTAGRQGTDVGRDQTPIVQLSLVLGSFIDQKIIDRLKINLRPDSFTYLATEPIATDTGASDAKSKPTVPISLDAMKAANWSDVGELPGGNSPNMIDALQTVDQWLQSHNISVGEHASPSTVLLITENHTVIRNVFHPQAAYMDISRSQMQHSPWCSYVCVLDWFHSAYDNQKFDVDGAIELLDPEGLASKSEPGSFCSKVDKIAHITCQLLQRGVPLCEIQQVKLGYEHFIMPRSSQFDDSCIVEVRQVPWGATPANIASFFAGLNVVPGGVAIRLTDGRRSNTAIVAFDCALCAQLALARHHHQFCGPLFPDSTAESTEKPAKETTSVSNKPVLLQVYSSSAREFVQCAGCDQPQVIQFLNQLTNGNQVVVRVRGLPYTATKQQIVEFFRQVEAPVLGELEGIFLVTNAEGRPTGDAFVLFNEDKTATRALTRHKDYLGDRYVELFKASPSEMVQVCFNLSQQNHQFPSSSAKSLVNPDSQNNRLRNSLRLGASNLNPSYLLQSNGGASLVSAPQLIPPSLIPFGSQIFPIGSTLDQNMVLSMPLHIGSTAASNPITAVSSQKPGSATEAFGERIDMSRDLKDPTDPDCPYARPLPPNGVSAMIQMSGLPLETSRHDVRLYLGPVNMAKVYRMRKMEPKPEHTSSTWLISISNATEGIQLIRDLLNRTFTLSNFMGSSTSIANAPQFSLYHVGPDKTPIPVPLNEPNLGIPLDRIFGEHVGHNMTQSKPADAPIDPTPGMLNSVLQSEILQQKFLQSLLLQSQLGTQVIPAGLIQLPHFNGILGTSFLPGLAPINPSMLPTGVTTPRAESQPRTFGPSQLSPGLSSECGCMVVLTGAPIDATNEELATVFKPIQHLLSSPPKFSVIQANPDNTVNSLVTFANSIEAQLAAICCPSSTLRSNQFSIGVAPLIPRSYVSADLGMPQSTVDPLTSNLMLLQASAPGLLH